MDTLSIAVGPVSVELIADDRICLGIRTKKPFEPDSLAAWAQMCRPGSEVVDVGAYSGLFSIAAAKLGCRPVAIEPLPQMRDRIAENAALNGVTFGVIPAAASDRSGSANIGFNERVPFTSGASLARKSGAQLRVRLVRLDDLKLSAVSAIKIDVERLEAAVIRGAAETILRHQPKLLVEVLDKHARREVERLLPSYRVEGLLDTRNLLMTPG